MAKEFTPLNFTIAECQKEAQEFENFLKENGELSEANQIRPFFGKRLMLSAMVGFLHSHMGLPDVIAFEYELYGDYVCDLVVGDRKNNKYVFIEFEEAKKDSIFRKAGKKSTLEWSKCFEHGYSQIIDWFEIMSVNVNTDKTKAMFGHGKVDFVGVLVVGRETYLDIREKQRLAYRTGKTKVDSQGILCYTFDGLLDFISIRLSSYKLDI
ncbi:MAG: DUF4263 domain-containing protein [Anaerolineae bacterium]|nr:DUF4263 domain-containing protein [Gloeobacterales cyanobacterium ES-bin-313]